MVDTEVEAMKLLSKVIWAKAIDNFGRYLLPRRPLGQGHDAEKDKLYDACGHLCEEGIARWLDSSSNFYPGIELIGRPW